jgi:hypothetical protein
MGFDADQYLSSYSDNHPEYTRLIRPFILRTPEDKGIDIGGYKVVYNPDFNYEYSFL